MRTTRVRPTPVVRKEAKSWLREHREIERARIDRIAGLTLREAIRYLEPGQQSELRASYRAR